MYGNEHQLNTCRNCLNVQTTLNSKIQHHKMCIEYEPGNPVMPNTEIRKCLRKKILESRWCNSPESGYRLTKSSRERY